MNNERHNTREVPTDFQWKLIEDITNGFAVEQKIGSGGYGVVYKGVHPNGQEIAVKRLHHMPGLDEDQFQNELRILTRIFHPNIVQLVGKSYIERDRCVEHQGRLVFATMIDRAICLEFLPEGSLEKHLSDEQFRLRWHSRYKIIKGICDGLKYLHGEKNFHLDLKPSNILLDKDMVPKIADFGLSRLFNGTRQSHTTKNLLCTLGYAPPEFVDKGKITNKFDVFSLGVIIIKVLLGPDGYSKYSDMPDSQDFIDLVQGNWREMLLAAGWKDASYLDVYCNQVKICTEIALKCVESDSHKRPSIEDIIILLNKTEETIDKVYRQLFVVEPPHLCFPFEPDKPIPCPVHLTNNADHDIAYRIQPNTPDIFVGSLNGVVPARSTQTYVLKMQKQQKPPPNLDTIRILSVVTNWDLGFIDSFDEAEVFHDERRVVKITSLYECASQIASKPRIEVLSLNRAYKMDVHPLEPWVLNTLFEGRGIEIWNYKTRAELDLSDMIPLRKGEYARWLDDDSKRLAELRAGLQAQLLDGNLGLIVEECMQHYDELFQLKAALARSDVFHLLTGAWATPAERCFFWMGGFRPSELLKILIPQLHPLTEQQLLGICNLQHSSKQVEEALAQGLHQLYQSLADTVAAGTLNDGAAAPNYMNIIAVALDKLASLENFYQQADHLRQQTLHQMRRILTTRQAARCFLSIGEYYSRLRALSNLWASRPRDNFIGTESLSPTATELQALHHQQQNQFNGF